MFQAVSLETDVDAAKVLAFSYPALREGLRRAENAGSELTAVVEDGLSREDERLDLRWRRWRRARFGWRR